VEAMYDRSRRSRSAVSIVVLLVLTVLALALPASALATDITILLGKRAEGLSSLTQVTNAGDGTDRLFLVEKRGTIRVFENGAVKPGYFMDIRSKVENGGERGLLGLAFHPDFETNHRLFVFYTRNGGDIVVSRYTTNAAGTDVIESTHSPLMLIEHSARSNHNGGSMAFGPDGYLYIGVGDGGGSGDPGNDAQQPSKNGLGKIHRIDVNGTGRGPFNRYSIPPTNPLAGGKKANDTVWAWGLRNPWRISFDRATGVFFITDVGQNRYEEINREPAGFGGGRNYGWRVYEGRHCYNASSCSLAGDTFPIAEYRLRRNGNCAITGGYVYRGTDYPVLVGKYVFADFCSGRILTMAANTPKDGEHTQRDTSLNITSFGESEDGELYLVTIDGRLYKVGAS
jgi:glucose/arabinose dehydrogenase